MFKEYLKTVRVLPSNNSVLIFPVDYTNKMGYNLVL